jgi:hypothetical protein
MSDKLTNVENNNSHSSPKYNESNKSYNLNTNSDKIKIDSSPKYTESNKSYIPNISSDKIKNLTIE